MPPSAMTKMPRAMPMTMAAYAKSAMPLTNSSAIVCWSRPPRIPASKPIPRNTAEISFMYQPWVTRPQTIMPIPQAKSISTSF